MGATVARPRTITYSGQRRLPLAMTPLHFSTPCATHLIPSDPCSSVSWNWGAQFAFSTHIFAKHKPNRVQIRQRSSHEIAIYVLHSVGFFVGGQGRDQGKIQGTQHNGGPSSCSTSDTPLMVCWKWRIVAPGSLSIRGGGGGGCG